MAMILGPKSLPAVMRGLFTAPNVALTNSMACRIYRNVKFGNIIEPQISAATATNGSLVFASWPPRTRPYTSNTMFNSAPEVELGTRTLKGGQLSVEVDDHADGSLKLEFGKTCL